jgi:hypothetical protein
MSNEFFEFVAEDVALLDEQDVQTIDEQDEIVLRYGTEMIALPYVDGASMSHYLAQLIEQGVDTSAVNVKYEGQYVSPSSVPKVGGVYSLSKTLDAKG